MDDQDFKTKVTRDQLEAMCDDIFKRIAGPVKQALLSSEMTMVSAPICLYVWPSTLHLLLWFS